MQFNITKKPAPTQITINKEELLKAVEFRCSSAFMQPENWMYQEGEYCMNFFLDDEKPSHKLWEGYDEFLKIDNLEDTEDNYQLFLQSITEYLESILVDEIEGKKIIYT